MERLRQLREWYKAGCDFLVGLAYGEHLRQDLLIAEPRSLADLAHNLDLYAALTDKHMARALGVTPQEVNHYRFQTASVRPSAEMEAMPLKLVAVAPVVRDVIIASPDANISCFEIRHHNHGRYFAVVALDDRDQPRLCVQEDDRFKTAQRYPESLDSFHLIRDSLELQFVLRQEPDYHHAIYARIAAIVTQSTVAMRAIPFGLVCQTLGIVPRKGKYGKHISVQDLEEIRI